MIKDAFHTKVDRYPGIKAFEKGQADLFYGREKEVNELFARLRTSNSLVLYSKSGLGKSSLLNAGLCPLLESRGFVPVNIRLQLTKDDESLVQVFKKNLAPYANRVPAESMPDRDLSELPLWEYFKTCEFPFGFTPVLIFDQFEELFSNRPVYQNDFLHALREIMHTEVPVRILKWYKTIGIQDRTDGQVVWCTQPKVKIIFSIREDRFGDLGGLTSILPGVLLNKYKLEPLTIENATMAITRPASLPKYIYTTDQFSYDTTTLDTIINKLSSGTRHVETTQMQIVCNQIENLVRERQENGAKDFVVTDKLFNGKDGLNDIINNFYDRQINQVPVVVNGYIEQLKENEKERYEKLMHLRLMVSDDKIMNYSRMLIETRMVYNGKRIFLTADQARDFLQEAFVAKEQKPAVEKSGNGISENMPAEITEFYPTAIINALLEVRLVRGEYRDDIQLFEICHDTLLAPINLAVAERKVVEEQERLLQLARDRESLLAEQKVKLIEARKQREIQEELRKKAEAAEALAKRLQVKASRAADMAKIAELEAIRQRDKAVQQKRKTRSLAFVTGGLFCVACVFLYFALQFSREASHNLYGNILNTAEKYYDDNNHYMSYALYREIGLTSNSYSDTAKRRMKDLPFFHISFGKQTIELPGNKFLVLNNDASLVLWSYTGKKRLEMTLVDSFVTDLAVNANNDKIAYRDRDGRISVFESTINFNPKAKRLLPKETVFEQEKSETALRRLPLIFANQRMIFTRPDNLLCILDNDFNVRIYDLKRNILLPKDICPLVDGIYDIQFSESNNALLITAFRNLFIYNVTNPQNPVLLNDTTVRNTLLGISKDGKIAFIKRGSRALVQIWQIMNGKINSSTVPFNSYDVYPRMTDDGERMFFVDLKGKWQHYSFRTGATTHIALLNRYLDPKGVNSAFVLYDIIKMDSTGNRMNVITKDDALVQINISEEKVDTLLQQIVSDYVASNDLNKIAWVDSGNLFYKNISTKQVLLVDTGMNQFRGLGSQYFHFNRESTLLTYSKDVDDLREMAVYDAAKDSNIFRQRDFVFTQRDRQNLFTNNFILLGSRVGQGLYFFHKEPDRNIFYPSLDPAIRKNFGIKKRIF